MPDGYFVTADDASQVEMQPGLFRRTMASTAEAMLCEFYLIKGAVVAPHSHNNDQVGYVILGQLQVTIGGEVQVIGPGQSYAIPGGIEHSGLALTDCIVIDVFSPPRNDYRTEAR